MLRDALVAHGLEVWYDESELGGGEAWDQKIRRQIRECDYFMPLISARTEARIEGYFRREWRLASGRTLDMADDHLFLLPVVLDDTNTATARVPEKFIGVQWLKVPGGRPNAALQVLSRKLSTDNVTAPAAVSKAARPIAARREPAVVPVTAPWIAAFPRQESGEKAGYWVRVILWTGHSAWSVVQRWPKWVRWAAYGWAIVLFYSNVHPFRHHTTDAETAAKVEKLKELAGSHDDLAKIGANIAKGFADDDSAAAGSWFLAIQFSAPAGDSTAKEFADTAFAKVFAQISRTHHGQLSVSDEPLPSRDVPAAVVRGVKNHADYVLDGSIETHDKVQGLTVRIVSVADGTVQWSKTYPVIGADVAKIAAEVEAQVPVSSE